MHWTVESIIALTLVPLGILVCLVCAFAGFMDDEPGIGVTFGVCAVLAAAALWWGMYPWEAEYHQWRPVAGTIQNISSRLVPSDHGTEQKFVVQFVGDHKLYAVLDTRAATAHPGDHLAIECVRRWQQAGTDGWDCMFDTLTPGVKP